MLIMPSAKNAFGKVSIMLAIAAVIGAKNPKPIIKSVVTTNAIEVAGKLLSIPVGKVS